MLPALCPPTIWVISGILWETLHLGGRRFLRSMLQKSYDPPESYGLAFSRGSGSRGLGCPGMREHSSRELSAPKSRDTPRLRRRFLLLPREIARFLRPQDARLIPCDSTSLANGDFFWG